MASSNTALAQLVAADRPMTASQLLMVVEPKAGASRAARKAMLTAIARLMQRGLAERGPAQKRQVAFGDTPSEVEFQATAKGRAFHAAGEKIASGKSGKRNGTRKAVIQPRYTKVWTVLRMMPGKKASTQQLFELAGFDDKGADMGRRYLNALCRAGIVTAMRNRDPGFAPTSPGFRRFAIIQDVGPRAPLMRRDGLFNPNTSALIAWPKEKS